MALPPRTRRRIFYLTAIGSVISAFWLAWPDAPEARPASTQPAVTAAASTPVRTASEAEVGFTAAHAASPPPASVAAEEPEATAVEPVPKVQAYSVEPGDTVEGIASRFGLEATTILWSNGLTEESLLQIGQELLIPATDGVVHTVAENDTMWEIADLYGADLEAVILANPDISPDSLQPGQQLVVPDAAPPRRSGMIASRAAPGEGTRSAPPAASVTPASAGGSSLIWPLSGELTELFGWRTHPVYGTKNYHEGIDIGVPEGTPIQAIASGRVVFAGWYGGYGLTVKIDHGDGRQSRYSHDSVLLVSVGDTVEAGQVIARSGNTGVSTGPHLDFGIYENGAPVDPLSLLP